MTGIEMLIAAGTDTILGMGIVFLILMLISFVIYLFKFLSDKEKYAEPVSTRICSADNDKVSSDIKNDITVVISAAIAAFEKDNEKSENDLNPNEYIVRTVRKRGK